MTIPVATGSCVVVITTGDRLGCLLSSADRRHCCEDKDIHLKLYELCDNAGQMVHLSFIIAILDLNIFPLDVTKFAHCLAE